MYNATGKLELTPEQHLIFLLGLLKEANATSSRWNHRKLEALARVEECIQEEKNALQSVANLEEWILAYKMRGVTV